MIHSNSFIGFKKHIVVFEQDFFVLKKEMFDLNTTYRFFWGGSGVHFRTWYFCLFLVSSPLVIHADTAGELFRNYRHVRIFSDDGLSVLTP